MTISVAQAREFGDAVIAALGAEQLPDSGPVSKLCQDVEQHAHDLLRQVRDPIAIGVVGEFSVGKSMLIGTLLGRPDLLPVEQRASTGNVTALYLFPGKPGEPTQLQGNATIDYLSESELTRCVEYMLGELAAAVRAIKRDDILPALDGYDPIAEGWNRLDAWCRTHIWPDHGEPVDNLEVRKIVIELLAVRDGHLCGRELLKSSISVDKTIVRDALDLGDGTSVSKTFPPRPGGGALSAGDVETDGAALRRTFPLIRRVRYRVLVDPLCWPLEGLTGDNEVLLLDFPGLTARRSAKRDEFLSRSVLRDTHTILTVYDAAKAGTNVPDTFYTMLEQHGRDRAELRESILAVGNALDKVGQPVLPSAGPVTMEELRSASQQFKEFYNGAVDLVRQQDDRIVLTSSVVAIELGRIPTSFPDEESAKLATARQAVPEVVARWRDIGTRVAEAEPDSPWVATMAGFVADGGFNHLRRLIERHATAHGLDNKLKGLQRQADRLKDALTRLCRTLPDVGLPKAAGAAEQARFKLTALSDDLRAHHDQLTARVAEFRDPLAIRTTEGNELLTEIQTATDTAVASWDVWKALLLRSDRGLIRKDQATELSSKFRLPGKVRSGRASEHSTTESFRKPFALTCKEQIQQGQTAFAATVEQWIADRNDEASELRERFNDPDIAELLGDGLVRISDDPEEAENRHLVLAAITDVSWTSEPFPDENAELDEATAEGILAGFPTAQERALPWHPAIKEPGGDRQAQLVRHQSYVFRQRRDLNNAAKAVVAAKLVAEIEEFHRGLQQSIAEAALALLRTDEIRRMFPAEPGGDTESGDAPRGESPLREVLREWKERDDRSDD
ncbi:hypothetical protein ABZS66_14005 [Dactylosporangium sp. NPDC005572]|uniref:hypothetical protein n=1 Tax=Dactylosporangium sp. NPDC005572 TaxID=3156889 RepID=UPI0033B9CE9E